MKKIRHGFRALGMIECLAVWMYSAGSVYDTKGFAFYEFVNADKNEKFDEYVRKCKRLSLYETNVIPEYGDDLLTLVTCEYSARNGRMVVVAKKIE